MREDILKELGLLPRWVPKNAPPPAPAAAVAAAAATAPETPAPPQPPAITAATTTAAAETTTEAAPATSPAAAPATTTAPLIYKMNWQQLQIAVENCRRCPLCERRKQPAFGSGDREGNIMFIGEGPGEEEDRQGEPFVGRAGKLLDLMLHAIQLDRRNNVYIANIVKCRPPSNRNPEPGEARECLPYLQRQIALVKPTLIVALGKVAATYLLNQDTSIAQLRQKIHEYQNITLVVTYHPAYLLRNAQEKRKSWEDLKFIRRLIS